VLGESLDIMQMFGGIVMLVGVYVAEKARPEHS